MRRKAEVFPNQEQQNQFEGKKSELTFDVHKAHPAALNQIIDKLKAVKRFEEPEQKRSVRLEEKRRNEREQRIHEFEKKDPERAYAMKMHDITVEINKRKNILKEYRKAFPDSRETKKEIIDLEARSQSFFGSMLKRLSPKLYNGYVGGELAEKRQNQTLAADMKAEINALQDRYQDLAQMHQFEKRKKEIIAKEEDQKVRMAKRLEKIVARTDTVLTDRVVPIRKKAKTDQKNQDKIAV